MSTLVYFIAQSLFDVALVGFRFRRNVYSLTCGPVLGCKRKTMASGELAYDYWGYHIFVGQIALYRSAVSTSAGRFFVLSFDWEGVEKVPKKSKKVQYLYDRCTNLYEQVYVTPSTLFRVSSLFGLGDIPIAPKYSAWRNL